MKEYVVKEGKELRMGFTTGSCATAATKAAATMLLKGELQEQVILKTPKGVVLNLEVKDITIDGDSVSCKIIKDAGDDPDATNGMKICSTVSRIPRGIEIDGGIGVGRVTKEGLACSIGEAAINPTPRKMIKEALLEVAEKHNYQRGFKVVISAEGGEEIAEKTFNPRLGIIGGISILGTSGIVEPMSEKALIETIHVEIDSRTANGEEKLLICPGNYGRDFALREFGIDLDTGIKCSNYIGEALDYSIYKGVKKLMLIGHAGKISKLAAGIMNTHSRMADGRKEIFAAHSAIAGATRKQVVKIMESTTTDEIDCLLEEMNLKDEVWKTVMDKIVENLKYRIGKQCQIEVMTFTNKGRYLHMTEGARGLIKELED
ncbi:MAG: cobalt-precorrin-5B (C(1))-methyltransferase CbiD [Clostridium sp.]